MGQPLELVYCAKDMGAANVTLPHAIMHRDNGASVRVVAEGIAAGDYIKAGFIPDFAGTVNFREVPFTFDAAAYLSRRFRDQNGNEIPGALVLGESSPANLEIQLGKALAEVNGERKIPVFLVECQDFWGGHIRLGLRPTLVITLDQYAKELIHKSHPHLADENVVIAGNPGAKTVQIFPRVNQPHLELRKRFGTIYYYAGGGEYTFAEIELLKECLAKTTGNWCLVAGFHPKHVQKYGDDWREALKPLGDRFVEAEPRTGDQWASLTTTLSGFSTVLTTATYYGQITAVLCTTASMKSLEIKSGLNEIPHAALGWATPIKKPRDLSTLKLPSEEVLEKLKPYEPRIAYQAIEDLFR